ncbi:hypothetical protein EJ06DRAFT_526768 [Trichodelitschia bisporula]|uniref:Uncharacterized protein n=1 Tax=Trichodelitschia bisporula TaxID=703511 RepID=A0A6G1I942_9PEZI|nr:hypothetical protein EJ06DRAFT_526768 [Trichodelitschia bisporula]
MALDEKYSPCWQSIRQPPWKPCLFIDVSPSRNYSLGDLNNSRAVAKTGASPTFNTLSIAIGGLHLADQDAGTQAGRSTRGLKSSPGYAKTHVRG